MTQSTEHNDRALGRLALAFLATLRNDWREEGGGNPEDILFAPEAFRMILDANNKAMAQ